MILNITPSMRIGLYLMDDYDKKSKLEKGTIVLFSPPKLATKNRIYHNPLLKKIVAIHGDVIEIKNSKLFINKKYRGEIQEKDSYGNKINRLSNGSYTISPGEYFVLGEHPNSYDSRYYGALTKEEISQVGKLFIPFSF
ncbi:hypothetical protein FSBG_00386 [Fusobacterium gonidiaformans 3-1-5R]|uniref:Signal peptidase I n=1 Tax=Fusobacterium gonidiaformans 3-1-5R TaxID=469605 RepID=E5BFK8_9FUSO|nr:hypothetical protein FSBG_00386 [Fusobacterium gonidiaformans 3-1-5R]